ncbi:hypothetical protein [Aquipuribacter sp. SD81]|uniref:hypothetical protein n=1 Tax=Aquipuribacter sp. SD81 TaxID=3127703 RepID=UPI00301A8C4A
MRIPRQPSADDRTRLAAGPVPATGADGAAPGGSLLQDRLAGLVDELRAVGYWQRLVQARTDLVVAGLLYGSPVPTQAGPHRLDPRVDDEPSLLAAGMDLERLLADLAPLCSAGAGPGEHLERLRGSATRLAARRRHLLSEVEALELALQDAAALEAERAAEAAARAACTPVLPAPS